MKPAMGDLGVSTSAGIVCLQLDGIPEADAAWFMQQLVCAVEFCHRLGVANRDIKVLPAADTSCLCACAGL